jgi:AbrB family looped-hinge helix DNA binding protein
VKIAAPYEKPRRNDHQGEMIIDTRRDISYYMFNSLTFQQENKMSLIKIKSKFQIVIPDDVRKRLKVEIGDTLEIEEKDGVLVARPVVVIDKSQTYFWSDEWQKGEREAEEAKKKGKFREFKNAEEAVKWLRS